MKDIDMVESFHLMGGMELVCHAVTAFPGASLLQLYGFAALGNLCSTSGGRGAVDGRGAAEWFVRDLEGVSLLAAAMGRFPRHEKMQEVGTWVLQRVCGLGQEQAPVMKEKAVVAVATALQQFPANKVIHKQAATFMTAVVG